MRYLIIKFDPLPVRRRQEVVIGVVGVVFRVRVQACTLQLLIAYTSVVLSLTFGQAILLVRIEIDLERAEYLVLPAKNMVLLLQEVGVSGLAALLDGFLGQQLGQRGPLLHDSHSETTNERLEMKSGVIRKR